jgi:hypothetical protein
MLFQPESLTIARRDWVSGFLHWTIEVGVLRTIPVKFVVDEGICLRASY